MGAGILLTAILFFFGRTIPDKKNTQTKQVSSQNGLPAIATDTILAMAKKQLSTDQMVRLNSIEHSVSRGDVKEQQLKIYRHLASFWGDSIGIFEPYAWYMGEAARLENSEKSLNFAGRIFLENLQGDNVEERKRWKALQAKDLFERSLKIDPDNDSTEVSLGACYLFGNISAMPMEGIQKIRQVIEKDSTNIYAQITLAKASVLSGQYDKAIIRLQTVIRLQPANLEAVFMLADVYEKTGDKANAIQWYKKSLEYINRQDVKDEIEKRIQQLSK